VGFFRVFGDVNEGFLLFLKSVLYWCHLAESTSHVVESSIYVLESNTHVAESSSHLVESFGKSSSGIFWKVI
jgi:hypothetical protein